MILVDIEKIEEIRICFDWATMIIPKNYVKKLIYSIDLDEQEYQKSAYCRCELESSKYCEKIFLEVDLDYIKNHKYYTGNDVDSYRAKNIESDTEDTIYERLKYKDVWHIDIINKDKSSLELIPPTYRKNYYCDNLKYIMADDAENAYEIHTINDNIFKMEWTSRDIYLTDEEIRGFFKKETLINVGGKEGKLVAELFKHILIENKKEDSIIVKIQGNNYKKKYHSDSLLDLKVK